MNHTSQSIREQNIDLLRFDDRRHFSFTEHRMSQGISSSIGVCSIIRRADSRGGATRDPFLVTSARSADWTTDVGDFALLGNRRDSVPSLLPTDIAHLLDSFANRENTFLVHVCSFCAETLFVVADRTSS